MKKDDNYLIRSWTRGSYKVGLRLNRGFSSSSSRTHSITELKIDTRINEIWHLLPKGFFLSLFTPRSKPRKSRFNLKAMRAGQHTSRRLTGSKNDRRRSYSILKGLLRMQKFQDPPWAWGSAKELFRCRHDCLSLSQGSKNLRYHSSHATFLTGSREGQFPG